MFKFIKKLFKKQPEYPPVESITTSADVIYLLQKVTQEQRDNIVEGIKQAKHDILNQSYEALDKEGNLVNDGPAEDKIERYEEPPNYFTE